MGELLTALVAAILGGSIVLAGDFFVRRAEEQHQGADHLQKSAADVIATYAAARSAMIGARIGGEELPSEERLLYIKRNKLWTYLACTPGSGEIEGLLPEAAGASEAMKAVFYEDEPEWRPRIDAAHEAIKAVERAVRATSAAERAHIWKRPGRGS